MIEFDVAETTKYLRVLLSFSKAVLQGQNIPDSEGSTFLLALQKIQNEVSSYVRSNGRQQALHLSIDPNILFKCKNPVLANRPSFFVSVGGYLKIQDGILKEQSLNLMLLYQHTDSSKKIPDDWHFYDAEVGLHVLRRFHFDYDLMNDDKEKPKSHMQFGGKFKSEYLARSDVIYRLFSQLDLPRLPHQPYDLVMLLDFILREFTISNTVVNEKSWGRKVVDCENIWLRPYFAALMSRLEDSNRKCSVHRVT